MRARNLNVRVERQFRLLQLIAADALNTRELALAFGTPLCAIREDVAALKTAGALIEAARDASDGTLRYRLRTNAEESTGHKAA